MANVFTQLINNGQTTLGVIMNSSVTSMTVSSGTGFPSDGEFYILINTEIMLVTSVTGSVWTVERGVEGTTAEGHAIDVEIKAVTTATQLARFQREHAYFPIDTTPRFNITDPATGDRAVVADFTWVNQGASTAVDRDGKIVLTRPPNGIGEHFSGLFLTAPAAPYVVVACFNYNGPRGPAGFSAAPPFPQIELAFRVNSSGRLMSASANARGDDEGDPWVVQVKKMTSATALSASSSEDDWDYSEGPVWFKIEDNNTNVLFYTSTNGIDWIQMYSETRTTWLAGGADEIGFGVNASADTGALVPYDIQLEVLHFGLE
jgi:hypothetical protein